MPLPKPKKCETKEAFISRCISTLTKNESKRFPSWEQRAYSQWGETPAARAAYTRKKADKDT